MDADFAAAMARAYNDWLYDFCQKDPNRLIGAGMISPYSMEDAVSEARRCAEQLGFRAAFFCAPILSSIISGKAPTTIPCGMLWRR